ncbi:SID1 transmembrane family member 1-like [Onthophagus taurus]|uniref:SID1 transmembrane family member 1-like n=1 Tax=Onthophagus taurus TaxID=166361 RepID=UPI0039BE35CB
MITTCDYVILTWIYLMFVPTSSLGMHSVIYSPVEYNTDIRVSVNDTYEHILSFPNTSTSNPYRIHANGIWSPHPAFVVVRQEKLVMSWEVPLLVSTSTYRIPFLNTARTLCFSKFTSTYDRSSSKRGRLEQVSDGNRNFSVSISTSSKDPIEVEIRAEEVVDYFLEKDRYYNVTVSASEPVFYFYDFPESEEHRSTVFIEMNSDDDVCLLASVQDNMCPIRDLNKDIRFEGDYLTFSNKGGLYVSPRNYPNGFFLVFVAMGDNFECNQESSLLPTPRKSRIYPQTRTSIVSFSIRDGITADDYMAATMFVFGLNLGFFIIFIVCVVAVHYIMKCRRRNDGEIDDDDDVVSDTEERSRKLGHDQVDSYLKRKQLTVDDFCINSSRIQKRANNYFWHITNIGIFYGIPVVQLMVTYQRTVNNTGDLDLCYHNFLCAHPLGNVKDFNHIYSNIGYMVFGILCLVVTLFLQRNQKYYPGCGIPRHYGLFYAMGIALILEGLLSACYHICPNQSNYQFDTSFMYVMAVLVMIKLYQNRHPRINASAYATFTILGAAVFLAMLGILTNSTAIMIIFVISYLFLCIFLSFKIYFMGYVIKGIMQEIELLKNKNAVVEALTPIRKGRFILLLVANMCNIAMAVVGIIFYPSYTDFGTYLLAILMINSLLHAVFYISMKLFNKERLCIMAILYILLSVVTWGASAYFFVNSSTMWTVTPAESRKMNRNCIFMDFYDTHDIWHLLSAPALFFTFMMLMHLDDDLAQVPRSDIIAF